MNQDQLRQHPLILTRLALSAPIAIWLLALVQVLLGGRVSGWQAVVGLGLATWFSAVQEPTLRRRIGAVALVALALAAALALALSVPDLSVDGLYYHAPGVYVLLDGWNPIWSADAELPAYLTPAQQGLVAGYPKMPSIVGTALCCAVGEVHARHLLHYLLLLGSFGPASLAVRACGVRSRPLAWLCAALAACNPIVLTQLATSYVDGMVASLLTILVCTLVAVTRALPPRGSCLLVGGAVILLVGTKFTGLIFSGIVLAGFVLHGPATPRQRRLRAGFAALLVAGALLVSGDAYLRNAICRGGSFVPAWRAGQPSTLACQSSQTFQQLPRWQQIARSLTSPQYSDLAELEVVPSPRWPGTELHWQPRYDSRFAGFGPLGCEAFVLVLLLWVLRGFPVGVMGASVLLSAVATEAAWWARLTPQWWLLPFLLLLLPQRPEVPARHWRQRLIRLSTWLLLAAMVANVLWVGTAALREARSVQRHWARALSGQQHEPVHRFVDNPDTRYATLRMLGKA